MFSLCNMASASTICFYMTLLAYYPLSASRVFIHVFSGIVDGGGACGRSTPPCTQVHGACILLARGEGRLWYVPLPDLAT